jgi:hypothetical protein
MDNVPMHKTRDIREKINCMGIAFYFLPNTPHLNSIEEVFSKWEGLIKVELE